MCPQNSVQTDPPAFSSRTSKPSRRTRRGDRRDGAPRVQRRTVALDGRGAVALEVEASHGVDGAARRTRQRLREPPGTMHSPYFIPKKETHEH